MPTTSTCPVCQKGPVMGAGRAARCVFSLPAGARGGKVGGGKWESVLRQMRGKACFA